MFKKVILDTDFCIRLGRFEKMPFLKTVIPLITEKALIHKYVLEDEILTPPAAKEQIRELVARGIVEVVDEKGLGEIDCLIFDNTKDKLKQAMVGSEEKGKNWGEVLSLAYAKVVGVPIFMSDEGNLQPIIDRQLNIDDLFKITVFCVIDVIKWVKDNPQCGVKRKTARDIWLVAASDKTYVTLEDSKRAFDKVWPIQ